MDVPRSPHSDSFLVAPPMAAEDDVEAIDEADTAEIPASKSVPPHVPPARVVTNEGELPSVIVDLKEVERAETDRASEVDGLLVATEAKVEDLVPVIEADHRELEPTRRAVVRPRVSTAPKLAIALVAALGAAGATFAGLKVSGVSAGSIGAALHVLR
jgi:hypothetical protein